MAKSRQQKRSQLQEKRIAADLGGRTQPGSGSFWGAKSDVRKQGQIRCEAKYTAKKKYTLKLADLLKIKDEAIRGGLETPVMQVEFVAGSSAFSWKYAIVEYHYFRHIYAFSNAYRTLQFPSEFSTGKSITISVEHMLSAASKAAAKKEDWALELIWAIENVGGMRYRFVVLDWNWFVTLHEAYQQQ
jgi:hypothetical protein